MRAERSDAGPAAGRSYPSPRAATNAPRTRATDRAGGDRATSGRATDPRNPDGRGRSCPPGPPRPTASAGSSRDERYPARPYVAPSGPRVPGAVAVLGMFALTLAAAAADSYIGVGLGMITLVALLAASIAAGLLVRRRDLFSVVVAPPLVFVGVAMVNIALAPSATFSLPTLATLLIRGFPAMGLAVGATIVICIGRLIARR